MDAGRAVMRSGDLFLADFVIFGMLQRSLDLVNGVKVLLAQRNFTCAVALMRLQLDNLARIAYMATLPNADEFGQQILSAKPLNKIQDAEGKALTDKRLREYAESHYPWIHDLYEKASRFIHFSDEHIFTSARATPERGEGRVALSIATHPERWSDEIIEEFAHAFGHLTERLLEAAASWGEHKVNIAARRKADRDTEV